MIPPTLLAALIQLVGTVGPELSKTIIDAIHGNPQKQGEADVDYIARMNSLTATLVQDTLATDAKVEETDSES